jgi:hypothetical protein
MHAIQHWSINGGKTPWHIDHLLGTVTFAVKRMLDALPVSVEYPDRTTEISTSKAEMVASLVVLEDIHEFLNRDEETATIRLLMELEVLYLKSFSVVPAAALYHGLIYTHEWTPVFQEFQAIVSSAIRYLQANEHRKRLEDRKRLEERRHM